MDKPDLDIKITMNGAEALAELKKLQQQVKKTGKEGKEDLRPIAQELSFAERQAQSLTTHFAGMATAIGGLKLASNVISAIQDGTRLAADEMTRMSKEFTEFRNKVSGSAGIQGKSPSNAFTVEQIRLADEAKVAPSRFAETQEAMNEQIAGNVGPGRQLTQRQADKVTQKMAQLGEARGISANALATLTGGIVRGVKGGPDADKEVLDRIGKLVDLMDKSPGKIERLLPELNEVMATGAGYEEAGQLVSVHAARGRPGEAGTYGRATQRAVARHVQEAEAARAKGEDADDLGITKDMNDVEASESIYKHLKADGVDLKKVRDVRGWLAGKGFKAQEEQDALMSMFNNGIEGGGLKNARDTIKAGGVGAIDRSIDLEQGSDRGRNRIEDAGLESERLRRGLSENARELERKKAERELTREGSLDEYTWGDTAHDLMPDMIFGDMGDARTRKINARATQNLRDRVKDAADRNGTGPYDELEIGYQTTPNLTASTVGGARNEQNNLIKILGDIEQNTRAKEKPLAIPPANPKVNAN